MNIGDYIAVSIDGEELALRDVLTAAKFKGALSFLQHAAETILVRREARQQGIAVSDEELQQAARDFRVANGLYKAEELNGWLAAARLSVEEWEASLLQHALARKLRDALTAHKAEPYFIANRPSFDVAFISHILVGDEDLARELLAQVMEDGADFYALAREHSTDAPTKAASGYSGQVSRRDLGAAAEAAVFAARAGEVVGPFKTSRGWRLIRVESVRQASLDEETREAIKSNLFEMWMTEQYSSSRVSMPLLEDVDLEREP
ncbi:MAG TPA: peptidylprolyl isomerase [Blastocatellia bacterium]|nr:peptidylprolyl isomerase [Blastocatellia bacterium]